MAAKLGRVNVDGMLRALTAKQFMEWEAYAALEPFSEMRMDYRFASINRMLANINRGKNQKEYTIEDIMKMLVFGEQEEPSAQPKKKPEPTREQAVQQQRTQVSIIKAIVAAYNAPGKNV